MISAIIITCNADLFIGAQIKHIYHHFDRIVVVDGPSMASKETPGDGRRLTDNLPYSNDLTLPIIFGIPDPHSKIKVITQPRPWISKTHKFNKALKEIEPGWVWQIDVDEFYHHEDYDKLTQYLRTLNKHTDVEFYAYHFWSSPDLHCVVKDNEWGNIIPWRRVFRYTGSETWERHEPPRLGRRTPNLLLNRESTNRMGFMLYHYGYCLREQFRDREVYYNLPRGRLTNELEEYDKTGQSPHKLVRFGGKHPIDINFLYETRTGHLHGNMCRTDVERDHLIGGS